MLLSPFAAPAASDCLLLANCHCGLSIVAAPAASDCLLLTDCLLLSAAHQLRLLLLLPTACCELLLVNCDLQARSPALGHLRSARPSATSWAMRMVCEQRTRRSWRLQTHA